MQSFVDIEQDKLLSDSRELLMNNDKTALSCSSGTSFPATNLLLGMLCLRTDQLKLYQLRDEVNIIWILVGDLTKTLVNLEDVSAGYSAKRHHHIKTDIDDFAHTHAGNDIAVATTGVRGAVIVGSGLSVDANGRIGVNVANNTVYTNPSSPKNGDTLVSNGIGYLYIDGWKQVYPAVYSAN